MNIRTERIDIRHTFNMDASSASSDGKVVFTNSENFATFLQLVNMLCVLPCMIMKMPQIVLLFKSKQTKGLSFSSILLEFYSYTTHLVYFFVFEYALMSYLEYTFLLVQDAVLIAMYLFLEDMVDARVLIVASIYTFGNLSLAAGAAPVWLLMFLYSTCLPISVSSKVLQLLAIYRAGDSSKVSLLTWLIAALTTGGRLITYTFDKGDRLVLFGFGVGMLLNTAVCCAILYYRPSPKKFK